MEKKKIIVILGPTATGKSDLAVKIARKINGEVISADSRQVYKGLNIATGKITKKEMRGIPHHLLDVVSPMIRLPSIKLRTGRSPQENFSVSEWQKMAREKMAEILGRGKTPIIVGGTGFYIQSIVDNIVLPEVPPNIALRKKLADVGHSQLFLMLKKLDPRRTKEIAKEKGSKNPVRLIRAIEIAKALGKVPSLNSLRQSSGKPNKYEFLQIGLAASPDVLKKKISIRLFARIKKGMIAEAKKLHKNGLSYKRMRELGLEYRYLADFLEKKITKEGLKEKIFRGNMDYAKRQMTWFKRDKRIKWFDVGERGLMEKIMRLF